MPFVTVSGVPKGAKTKMLEKLRIDIVEVVSENMSVPKKWVRPFFPVDMLDEPTEETEGCNTIYVLLDTGMFFVGKMLSNNSVQSATAALANIIWEAFDGEYEVEVFIGNLNPDWKTIIHKKN